MREKHSNPSKLFAVAIAVILLLCGILVPLSAGCDDKVLVNDNPKEEITGKFYSLQKAYDDGLLSRQDLMNIASYPSSFGNAELALSVDTQLSIKEACAESLRNRTTSPITEATADDITIEYYFGTYNNCVAVIVSNAFTLYSDALWDDVIAGVVFHYYNGNSIIIWKQS
ncbi:MAG: hypothetical protein FWH42_01900 [Dehalococcoidia bacterium]|nr:hypothetical protein [Dehalococcoidia bacterium]